MRKEDHIRARTGIHQTIEWLTGKEKKQKLELLRRDISNGEVDREFISYLNRLNVFPNVCTTQCCSGKGKKSKNGYLSLRFRKNTADYFKKMAIPVLLAMESIPEIHEDYELFDGAVRQRTVIWFRYEKWDCMVEKVIGELKKIRKHLKRKTSSTQSK